MSVTHTYEVFNEHPRPIITPNYPAIAIEELSQRYKALIEAERKHFMAAEHEYNDFICKMDIIHQDLEDKLNNTVQLNNELRHDNEDLARRLRDLELDYEKKCETLKKLYYVHLHQTRKLESLEFDNVDLKVTADKTVANNFEIHNDLKNVLKERDYLDERMADLESRHTLQTNRLNSIIADKDKQLLDRDREIDRLSAELRKVIDENHHRKMDIDSLRMNFDSMLHQKDLEIAHVRRLLDDQRYLGAPPSMFVDQSGNDETIRKLKANLEDAYRTIESLQKRKHQVDIVEKPRFIETYVEKPVERIIRVPEERERETYRRARPGVDEDEDRMEQILILARRNFERKLTPLYYTIWKLLFYIDYLEKSKNQRISSEKILKSPPPQDENLIVFKDGLISVYHDVRRGIVDYLFEIFVRSANSAHQKKVNSLILFIINIKELKEHNLRVFLIVLDTFMRIREVVKLHSKASHKYVEADYGLAGSKSRIKSPDRSPDNRKNADPEFRDMTNNWIQESLVNVKKRRGFDKHDPKNMEYLYLFRLLAIKYRCVYPLRGKALLVDGDLAVKLETKICKAFLRVLEIQDEDA